MEVGSSFFWLHCRLFIFVEVLVEFDKLCIRQPNPNNYCDSEASCFVQERPNMAQNWHFCSFWARPCWLIWCPVGGLVGGCGARAVSRKTPIYFIICNARIIHSCYMDLKSFTWTFQSCNFCPLLNQTKLLFEQSLQIPRGHRPKSYP